jgi:hemerythrin-like metal-binding protein
MTFLSWRRDYEIGVPQIDAEHHRLADMVNTFHETYLRGGSREEIPHLLNQLIAYAEEHFQHEEKLMSDSGYPRLDEQRALHEELVTSIFAINERLSADRTKAGAEVLQFIKNWLLDHIVKHDMDIGDFLRRKASKAKTANEPGKSEAEAKPKQ